MNRKTILYSLIFLFSLGFVISWIQRAPHIDDAWLGEHAYQLVKSGEVRSVFMSGFRNSEEHLPVYHKLHTLYGSIWIRIFGWNLYALKSSSLLFMLILLIMTYRYVARNFEDGKTYAAGAVLILISHPLIYEFAFVYRPELIVSVLGFVSYLMLRRFFVKKAPEGVLWSGIWAGLAVAVHLNGLVFAFAGAALLLSQKKVKTLGLYTLSGLAGSLFYFWDLGSWAELYEWKRVLTQDYSGVGGSAWLQGYLYKLINEQMRYFHSPKEIVFSLLILVSVFTVGKKLIKARCLLFYYTLFLTIGLGLLTISKTSKYLIPLIPFFTLIILKALQSAETGSWREKLLLFSLGSYLMTAAIYDFGITRNKNDLKQHSELISKRIDHPNKKTILAPMEFSFHEMPKVRQFRSLMSIHERMKTEEGLTGYSFLGKMNEESVDHLIIRPYYVELLELTEIENGDLIMGYRALKAKHGYLLLDRTSEQVMPGF